MKASSYGMIILAAFLTGALARADRTDVWSAASVVVGEVRLFSLPDGGCSVQAFASLTKSDGGSTYEGSSLVDVSGANRTTCLDILNNKAPNLFKADKGL